MFRDKSSYSVQSVEKALDMLELISEGRDDATLPHLAENLGITRNKAFRLLATLESRGLVQREDQTGVFRIGLNTVGFAQRVIKGDNLIKYSHSQLEELSRRHEESIYLAVLMGETVLFIDEAECPYGTKAASLIGTNFPCLSNAPGKLLLALEFSELPEKFFKKGRHKMAPSEVTGLERELDDIRSRGVAVCCEGLGEGIVAVAVAIRDYAGKVVGAITLVGPSFRLATDRIENDVIPSLLESADILSMKFGFVKY